MEENNSIEKFVSHVKEYVETRYDLIVLTMQDKISDMVSSLASYALFVILFFFMMLFVSLGAAKVIGDHYKDTSIGFFFVGGFYLLLSVITIVIRKKLIKLPIVNAMLKKMNVHEES